MAQRIMHDTKGLDALAALCGSTAVAAFPPHNHSRQDLQKDINSTNGQVANPAPTARHVSVAGNPVLLPEVPPTVMASYHHQQQHLPSGDAKPSPTSPTMSAPAYAASFYAQQAASARAAQQAVAAATAAAAAHHHHGMLPSSMLQAYFPGFSHIAPVSAATGAPGYSSLNTLGGIAPGSTAAAAAAPGFMYPGSHLGHHAQLQVQAQAIAAQFIAAQQQQHQHLQQQKGLGQAPSAASVSQNMSQQQSRTQYYQNFASFQAETETTAASPVVGE